MALFRKRIRLVFVRSYIKRKTLKTSEPFLKRDPSKIIEGLGTSFVRMRAYAICVAENGNTKYGSTHTIASFLYNGLFREYE